MFIVSDDSVFKALNKSTFQVSKWWAKKLQLSTGMGFLLFIHSFIFSTRDLVLRPNTCHSGLATAATISTSDLITKKFLNELLLVIAFSLFYPLEDALHSWLKGEFMQLRFDAY